MSHPLHDAREHCWTCYKQVPGNQRTNYQHNSPTVVSKLFTQNQLRDDIEMYDVTVYSGLRVLAVDGRVSGFRVRVTVTTLQTMTLHPTYAANPKPNDMTPVSSVTSLQCND